jgi:hypothetical protein
LFAVAVFAACMIEGVQKTNALRQNKRLFSSSEVDWSALYADGRILNLINARLTKERDVDLSFLDDMELGGLLRDWASGNVSFID